MEIIISKNKYDTIANSTKKPSNLIIPIFLRLAKSAKKKNIITFTIDTIIVSLKCGITSTGISKNSANGNIHVADIILQPINWFGVGIKIVF